jgi:hypothetical protein
MCFINVAQIFLDYFGGPWLAFSQLIGDGERRVAKPQIKGLKKWPQETQKSTKTFRASRVFCGCFPTGCKAADPL